MSVNVESIVECVAFNLPEHPISELLGDTIVTSDDLDFFTEVNPYSTTNYDPVIHVAFAGYQASNNGKGYLKYRVCLYSMSSTCHECFFHFLVMLASCCTGLTLTSVTESLHIKPVYKICATFTAPLDQCSMCIVDVA